MCSMKGELRVRERAYADPVLDTLVELNGTVDQREQRVVLATANVLTRVDVRAVLTDENRARGYRLAGIALRAKALTAGVTAITGGTESFFVCHCVYLLFRYECNLLGDGSLGNSLSLCLDSLLGAGGSLNLHDLQLGELLTVTLQTTIALTLVELEDQLLLALELLNDLSGNLGLGQLVGIGEIFLPSLRKITGRVILSPSLPSIFSTVMTSSVATLYCLPPVLTIAYMFTCPSCIS